MSRQFATTIVRFRNVKIRTCENGEYEMEMETCPLDNERINELLGRLAEEAELSSSQRADLGEQVYRHSLSNAIMAHIIH